MMDKIVPPALQLWLVFLFAFLLLGYGVVLSIVLGAIAGLAGGTILAWWVTPGGEPTAPLELPAPLRQLSPNRLGRFLRRGGNAPRGSRPKEP